MVKCLIFYIFNTENLIIGLFVLQLNLKNPFLTFSHWLSNYSDVASWLDLSLYDIGTEGYLQLVLIRSSEVTSFCYSNTFLFGFVDIKFDSIYFKVTVLYIREIIYCSYVLFEIQNCWQSVFLSACNAVMRWRQLATRLLSAKQG